MVIQSCRSSNLFQSKSSDAQSRSGQDEDQGCAPGDPAGGGWRNKTKRTAHGAGALALL